MTEWSDLTKVFLLCGILSFIASLFFTSLYTSAENIQGFWLLIMGWLAFLFFQYAWFANPINLLALLLLSKKPGLALILSFSALLAASQSFMFSEIPIGMGSEVIFIKELGLGVYIWYLAQILFLLAIMAEYFGKRAGRNPALSASV